MIETFVGGLQQDYEWMLNLVTCDCILGTRKDYMWFFNTREEAEKHLYLMLIKMPRQNVIAKIIKIHTIEKEGELK